MKVKDLVDMKGCYSAHDVGELEVPVLSVDEIDEVMKIKDNEIGEVMFGWERKMQAEAIHKAMVEKRGEKTWKSSP